MMISISSSFCNVLFCVLYICAQIASAFSQQKPNIVFILADDLGWNDVGYHGSEISTPVIDSLAHRGIKLESYYVQPMCSPSRASLMSGRYPIHTGLQHEVIYAGQRAGLPLEIKTLPQQLKSMGYVTHGIGKWHLGFFKEEYLPTNRGFDTWVGYMGGNEDYYRKVNCEQLGCGYDFYNNSKLDFTDNNTYSTLQFTKKAGEIITKHDKSHPLFLYLPYQAVHFPMQVPASYIKPYVGHIKDEKRRIFAGMMSCLDEAIGNVTQYLKSAGMWNNTILIFSTDNGGETAWGGNNWPLRGKKWTLWEGGVHGPAFIHSPLINTTSGQVYNSLMHITDWYPTILNGILGKTDSIDDHEGNSKVGISVDGVNQWNSILNNLEGPRKEILHNIDPLMPHPGNASYNDTFPTNTTAAIRVGDWKLLTGYPGVDKWFPTPASDSLKRHEDWLKRKFQGNRHNILVKRNYMNYDREFHKPSHYDDQDMEMYSPDKWKQVERMFGPDKKNVWLFNITADPEEIVDLSDQYPEVVRQLLDRLQNYNKTAIKPNFPDVDPEAAPSKHNNTWVPWVSKEDSFEEIIDYSREMLVRALSQTVTMWSRLFNNQ